MPSWNTSNETEQQKIQKAVSAAIAARDKQIMQSTEKAAADKQNQAIDASRKGINDQAAAFDKFAAAQMSQNAPQMQNAQTQQSRAQQMSALQMLQGAASGVMPSAAQGMMQQGNEQAIAQQMAMANSTRGGFNPAAIRQAQMQGAAMQQANVQNMANLRAQEMAQAQQAYAGQANALSQTDYGAAAQQGQFDMAQREYQAQLQQNQFANRMGIYGSELGQAQAQAQLATQQAIANQQNALARRGQNIGIFGSILGGLAGGLAMSDKRQKTDISEVDTKKLLDSIKSYSYKYKDSSLPGTKEGERFGFMAQDLEKTAIGKSAVVEHNGNKMVDTAQVAMLALAALSDVNKRIEKFEKKRA